MGLRWIESASGRSAAFVGLVEVGFVQAPPDGLRSRFEWGMHLFATHAGLRFLAVSEPEARGKIERLVEDWLSAAGLQIIPPSSNGSSRTEEGARK